MIRPIYILSASVIPNYGIYLFEPVALDMARKMLIARGFVSTVGHKGTANFLSKLLGFKIPHNRIRINMERDDIALVFKINTRLEEGAVLSETEVKKIPYEIGLLRRIE